MSVIATFPPNGPASAALVRSRCGGNACNWDELHLAYLHKNELRVDSIGRTYGPDASVTVEINSGELLAATARRVLDGTTNALGDMRPPVERKLLPGRGFIGAGFNARYISLIGQHPESFFSDAALRGPFARLVGAARFKAYREAMDGPGGSQVGEGRYLVFNACKAHNCGDVQGVVILDGTTGDVWMVVRNVAAHAFASDGTAPMTAETLDRISPLIDMMGDVTVAKDGKLRVR